MDLSVLWKQIDDDRRAKIEAAVEQMITDPEQRGVLIRESQYGVLLSAELSSAVPYGTVIVKREDVYNGIVSPPAKSGEGT